MGTPADATLPIVPIMITTDPVAAAGDCLFYIVREPDSATG